MKTKPLGYTVINETLGLHLSLMMKSTPLWPNIPPEGVLLCTPKTVTVFPTRAKAHAAIKVTRAYFKARGNLIADAEFALIRLVPAS